ncbi:MAG: UDP-glucose 4-epimerase GalE [Candidatus Melainabacteria bacterium]|jgi:UDP-glucose 4-epimerase|nr:UDP-glucose 4-epimerase GalE [Candidatus Melainabacteria bacterium]
MILITGGLGYVGSHFALEYLQDQDSSVVIVDDLSLGHREVLDALPVDRVHFYEGRVGDDRLLAKILETHGQKLQAVVHFAARAYVGESQVEPFLYFDRNVIETLKLLQAVVEAGIKRFVFSSTCSTFGNPQYTPLDEKHPQKPINTYGSSKLMLEEALRALALSRSLKFVMLRYFNAAGADFGCRIGESHEPETHLIPLAIQAALGKRDRLSVYGNDYDTPDGTCIRDYIHVQDLAQAHVKALNMLGQNDFSGDLEASNNLGLAVNLGTSTGSSIMQVMAAIQKVSGRPVPHVFEPRRPGDPGVLVADNSKARDVLSWSPQYNLEQIIESAYRWEANRSF